MSSLWKLRKVVNKAVQNFITMTNYLTNNYQNSYFIKSVKYSLLVLYRNNTPKPVKEKKNMYIDRLNKTMQPPVHDNAK